MEFLQNPNVVYMLLAGGLMFAVLALAAPGTGVLELGALFIIGVAGWSVVYYNLPINWWAVLFLVGGSILFLIAVFKTRTWPLLAGAIVLIVIGSAFLFYSKDWFVPAVNPVLALVVSVLSGGFFWMVGRKAIQAAEVRPTHDLGSLIGKLGEAKTHIHDEGTVQVEGELWSARSETPVQSGDRVRVVAREGFTLLVEPVPDQKPAAETTLKIGPT
jgi:membrane-bound serine protease (ClpP class)